MLIGHGENVYVGSGIIYYGFCLFMVVYGGVDFIVLLWERFIVKYCYCYCYYSFVIGDLYIFISYRLVMLGRIGWMNGYV